MAVLCGMPSPQYSIRLGAHGLVRQSMLKLFTYCSHNQQLNTVTFGLQHFWFNEKTYSYLCTRSYEIGLLHLNRFAMQQK